MSKRKKTQISENQELSISKAKKTYKRKSQSTRDCDLEKPAEASDPSNTLSKTTIAEVVQECKEHGLDNTETEILPTDLDASLAEERGKASSERKGPAKCFVPPSQGEKLVPVFAKTKNKVPERCEGNNGDTPAIQMKQDVLESSEAECMVRNAPHDTAEKVFQTTAAPSESLELTDLSVTNKEDIGDQGIPHREETLDVKIPNQDRVISMNNGGAVPGFIVSQPEEAQKQTDIPANISEKQKVKSKKRVSFFLCTSDNKGAESLEEGELSTGSLDHVKSNHNEEAREGPSLQTEHGTKYRCETLVPVIKQSEFDNCESRPDEISETSSKGDADQQMDGKGKTVVCGENKFVCAGGCVSSAENILQLDGAGARSESSRENLGSEDQRSLLSGGKGSGTSALGSLDTVAHRFSAAKDPLSVDLDFLLDSQLQSVFESNSLEHPPYETFSLDLPCTAGGTRSTANVAHPKDPRDEMTARICDPSKEEDATDIVCGLIKELSNLNRLVMSAHRDLDSFKRQKFQRYRQSGKLLPHGMSTTTNMRCTVKKKKRMSLANAVASCNICKGLLRSSDVSSAVTSKAVIAHNVEADV